MARYRKKPVVIEARIVPPADDLQAWGELAGWLIGWLMGYGVENFRLDGPANGTGVDGLLIQTLEGDMKADIGDWIICGVAGESYPCKPDIFDQTYEAVD